MRSAILSTGLGLSGALFVDVRRTGLKSGKESEWIEIRLERGVEKDLVGIERAWVEVGGLVDGRSWLIILGLDGGQQERPIRFRVQRTPSGPAARKQT